MRGTQGGGSQAGPSSSSSGGTVYADGPAARRDSRRLARSAVPRPRPIRRPRRARLRGLRRSSPDAPSRRLRATEGASERGRAAPYRFGPLERRGLIGSLRPPQVLVDRGEPHRRGDPDAHAARRRRDRRPRSCSRSPRPCSASGRSPAAPPRSGCRSSAATRRGASAGGTSTVSAAPQAGVQLGTGGRPEPVVALPERGARPRAARGAAPRRDGRRDQGPPRAHLHRGAGGQGDLVRAPRSRRAGEPPGRLGRRARRASPARDSPVSRIQWIERTVPPTATRSAATSARRGTETRSPLDSLPMQSYLDLDERRARRSRRTTSCSSACRSTRSARGGRSSARAASRAPDAGACAVLLRELEALAERLAAADVQVVGALRPGMLASAIRVAFDPWSRPGLARLAAADPDRDGIDEGAAWPVATRDVVELVPDRRRVPRDLLDRELAAHRRRRSVPLAAPPSRADGAGDRGHDRADLAAEGDPRGRGRADDRRRRPASCAAAWASSRPRDGGADGRGDRAARGGARRRARRGPVRRLRHRLRAHRSRSSSATAPRSSTPRRWRGSSCSASTASRTRRSPTRCRSAEGCDEHAGPARTPGDDRPRPGRVPVRRRGRARRPRRLHRPRRLRRIVLLRPVGALRQGADEPERRRDRHRRPREVEPRQDVRASGRRSSAGRPGSSTSRASTTGSRRRSASSPSRSRRAAECGSTR